ncbi:MAG: tRNA-dihydrouridine synthase, partial [Opitutaceae bacterium]
FYNPWIFAQTIQFLDTGLEPPEPRFEDRMSVMRAHLDHMIAFFGERNGCLLFRKIGPWYVRRAGPSSFFRRGIFSLSSRAGFEDLLAGFRAWRRQFLDDQGELQDRFRPAPARVVFAGDETDEATETCIPVPHGPIAVW